MSPGHNARRFSGKRRLKRPRRKGKSLNKKMRRARMGRHNNKYAHLAPKRPSTYDADDKTFRALYLRAKPGQAFQKGQLVLYHGRTYRVTNDATTGDSGLVMVSGRLVGVGDR